MTLSPTPEQSAIVDAAVNTSDSLLLSALAGSAKTTTLVMIAEKIQGVPILSVAFNKKIAEEMKSRFPSTVKSATLNSVGHGIWQNATAKRLVVEPRKMGDLVKTYLSGRPRDKRPNFFALLAGLQQAKNVGYLPRNAYEGRQGLTSFPDFINSFDEEPDDDVIDAIDDVLKLSIAAAYAGNIDYDDQIYMPVLFGGSFPQFPLVLVDEAQDLSPLNHAFLRKLVAKRLIAVGDRNQSIYGFRGAMPNSMDALRDAFNMREMDLTICFRCPKAVIREAQKTVPAMQWPEWAEEGEVERLAEWSVSSIPPNAAIICRNNAPLFRMALHLLRAGRGCKIAGSDIGPGIIKLLKELGEEEMTREEMHEAIAAWEKAKLKKAKHAAPVHDKADAMRVFADFAQTLGSAISFAEHIFKAEGPVTLMTGHKAKGLEFDDVIFLDPWRIPNKYAVTEDELQQEYNVRYVITTRAKKRLIYADLEMFL